jgi:N-acetylglucosaminyldiphosphoundecaprenol N-acetyl-beta-D-mannosaminyltransferase
MRATAWIWGLPLSPLTRSETADEAIRLVESGGPAFFITANLHYAMLADRDPDLRAINTRARFLVADGAPLVWASRWKGTPLPERVAGSDLIYDVCERAAARNYRLFFLGGADGVAETVARRLSELYPGFEVVGTLSPPHRELTEEEEERLLAEIRSARPHILLMAYSMPRGEVWVARNHERLGVPLCLQVGATFDFVAGRVRRAPLGWQKLGMEWAYRLWLEPTRLFPRYARNAWFMVRMIGRDLVRGPGLDPPRPRIDDAEPS